LIYVSPTQINFQTPFEASLPGNTTVVVTANGTTAATITAALAEFAPGIFGYARVPGSFDPVIVHADNALVTPGNPAGPAEVLVVYATGVGSLDNPLATGAASPSSPLATPKIQPTVSVGGAPAEVLFAGLTPGYVGLTQFNIRLPATLPAGVRLPLVIRFGADESSSPPAYLAVRSGTPVPAIRANPSGLDFGNVNTGQSADLSLAINNLGAAPLTVGAANINNPLFSLTGPLPLQLAPGEQRAWTVRFRPTGAGDQSGTLTIASNDPAAPSLTVNLSGTGASPAQAPAINVSPTSLDFGTVMSGQTKDLTLTVRNNGNATLRHRAKISWSFWSG
jgi:uncharacterized protein (TIGR03437 family)